ncbi:efflux RND transporter permease subunit [Rhizobium sp. TRM95796]|uniref:efflux RND transporter permease subunit n=1 Tax=Rhizobium sp. TRM95796 TaxID=2979862 RepID=UPI0021E93DED|nr:efflux RND transporter permease subunit [Rhizobium sp. TRM95796]MCV3764551.1 efflux RND transporter permease subunit [Rhizobium sp. TRM95796]
MSGAALKQAFSASLFVRRPILALVVNALIVVAGLAALSGVEVRELPSVDQPVITVRTELDGASPETIDREVTDVIEGAVARVTGLKSVSSTSAFGSSRVTLEFSDTTDLAAAAADVRDALGRVNDTLPEDVTAPRIIKADADSQPVMRLAVTSTTMRPEDLTVYIEDKIEPRLATVEGVADLQYYGEREKAFRIDIDQAKLASRGLTIADIRTALSTAALDVPAGSIESAQTDIVVRATSDITTPEAFERLIISGRVRLGDVADVSLGAEEGTSSLRSNGAPGVGLGIVRQAQSNTLDISQGIRSAVAEISKSLPEGMTIRVTSDDANFIRGAIHEVVVSLVLAVVIVVAVIYLFLRSLSATLIPTITMPVALIGTLAALYLAGFSINILTLLAIVLATGMVVDDAIVVLENIVRFRSQGMGPRAAAVLGTQQVFFAVVATTITLAAVFVPLAFLPGQAGGLFREFGFALAIAVMLSGVVALTLCPMLASRFVGPQDAEHDAGGLLGAFGRGFAYLYEKSLGVMLAAPGPVIALSLLFSFAAAVTFFALPQELTPREDRATVLVRAQTPQGSSLAYTEEQLRRVQAELQPLVDSGEVVNMFVISGQGGNSNSGFMVLTLAPWEKRVRNQAEISDDVRAALRVAPALQANIIQPNSLGIRGAGGGLNFALTGNDYQALYASAAKMIDALNATGRFELVRLDADPTQAQISVNIDRERAADIGVDISGLASALQALLSGSSIGDVFLEGRRIGLFLTSSSNPINDPQDLENIFLKTADGKFVPLSTVASLTERSIPPQLARENQTRSVSITASPKGDLGLGDALALAETIAAQTLPDGVALLPLSEAATLGDNSSGMALVFGFALVIIFLVLAAQFESFLSALIIMATVPLGLACAVFAMAITGQSINIYSQIGLVLLVGIMAKNGILIVEFANQLRDEGQSVGDAIRNACRIRLRPVMMTMIATVLGGVPLTLAVGAGAEARVALGWVIVGGLGLATLVTLYITPVAYLLIAGLTKPHAHEEERLAREMSEAEARELDDEMPLAAE